MKMPDDFQLLNAQKDYNHICQNVPVTTAKDMAHEVVESLKGNRTWEYSNFVIQNNYKQKIEEMENQTNSLINVFGE